MTATEKAVRAHLERMEPAEPQGAILAYLKGREGKTLTKRDLPALQAIDPTIRFRKIAGMTYIEWGSYDGNRSMREGGSLLIAYTEGACAINAAWVEEHNTAWFSASVARNAERKAALDNAAVLRECAAAIDACNAAVKTIKALIAYGAPLNVVQFDIEALLPGKV